MSNFPLDSPLDPKLHFDDGPSTGPITNIDFCCPEQGQEILAPFQTSNFDIRNKARKDWCCSGHQISMSRIEPVSPGPIPGIKNRCPGPVSTVPNLNINF